MLNIVSQESGEICRKKVDNWRKKSSYYEFWMYKNASLVDPQAKNKKMLENPFNVDVFWCTVSDHFTTRYFHKDDFLILKNALN